MINAQVAIGIHCHEAFSALFGDNPGHRCLVTFKTPDHFQAVLIIPIPDREQLCDIPVGITRQHRDSTQQHTHAGNSGIRDLDYLDFLHGRSTDEVNPAAFITQVQPAVIVTYGDRCNFKTHVQGTHTAFQADFTTEKVFLLEVPFKPDLPSTSSRSQYQFCFVV